MRRMTGSESGVMPRRRGGPRDALANINLQLARIMETTAEEARRRPRTSHNFAEIGVVERAQEAACLEHIMADYVQHMNHHLAQIFERPGERS